jgi:hypothetical protein
MRYAVAFLELRSPNGSTVRRWQSRWEHQSVSWDSATWDYCAFTWSGIVAGGSSENAQTSLGLPRLPSIEKLLRQSQRQLWSGRLRVYHYAEGADVPGGPPASSEMILVGSFRGLLEVSGAGINSIQAGLSAGQTTDGPQFPPRLADTAMIGVPCVVS